MYHYCIWDILKLNIARDIFVLKKYSLTRRDKVQKRAGLFGKGQVYAMQRSLAPVCRKGKITLYAGMPLVAKWRTYCREDRFEAEG